MRDPSKRIFILYLCSDRHFNHPIEMGRIHITVLEAQDLDVSGDFSGKVDLFLPNSKSEVRLSIAFKPRNFLSLVFVFVLFFLALS